MKNREIKFRAWDSKNKKWLEFVPCEEYMLDSDTWDSPDQGEFEEMSLFYPQNPLGPCFGDRVIYQQFTGRKDSKGVEIYEGDIVNVNGGNHIIEWRGAGFAATWSDYNLDTCWFVGGGPVIIGNIFENVELATKARENPKL